MFWYNADVVAVRPIECRKDLVYYRYTFGIIEECVTGYYARGGNLMKGKDILGRKVGLFVVGRGKICGILFFA